MERGIRMSTAVIARSNLNASPFRICIIKQSSPFEEKVTRNGIQKDVHVVIKNSPFLVQIGRTARGADVDLNHVAFDVALLYDTEGEKGVDFVKVKPLEFKALPSDIGDQATVELRIKVLTSQHEDMFFKVRIQGFDPVTKLEIPDLKCITSPIKVISKPEQLKKRQPTKKRTLNDMVVDAITRIEKQQTEQQRILEQLLDGGSSSSSSSSSAPISNSNNNNNSNSNSNKAPRFSPSTPLSPSESPLDEMCNNNFTPTRMNTPSSSSSTTTTTTTSSAIKDDLGNVSFESLFSMVLKQFSSMDPHHKAEKIRRIVREASARETECISELLDVLSAQGLGNDLGRETQNMGMMQNQQGRNMQGLGIPHHVINFPQVPLTATQFAQFAMPPQFNHVHLDKDCSCAMNFSNSNMPPPQHNQSKPQMQQGDRNNENCYYTAIIPSSPEEQNNYPDFLSSQPSPFVVTPHDFLI